MNNDLLYDFLKKLETGVFRAATKINGIWAPNLDVKNEILNIFKKSELIELNDVYSGFVDKDNLVPRKFFKKDNIRVVPGGTSIRPGCFIASSVIIMPPSYVNIGAYVDAGSLIDSHVLVGSCAQVGKNVHLSAGVQLGGVLEPIGMNPVIIEDNVFIGAGSIIVEGIIVGTGAVIAPSVVLSRGVNIYDAVNEVILEKNSKVPDNAVVVPGSRPLKNSWAQKHNLHIYTPVIIKYRDDKSNKSLSLEEILR